MTARKLFYKLFCKKERGNALLMTVISFGVLLGMAGLVIDWGRGVWVKTQLKKAADAAALAGAGYLPDENAAQTKAQQLVYDNYSSPDAETYIPGADTYTVQLEDNVTTLIMRLFGHSSFDVVVSSTAMTSRPIGGLGRGAFPFAIINPDKNNCPDDDLVESNYGRPYILAYGQRNIMVEDWANGCDPMPLNPGHGGGSAQGWRSALRLNSDGTYGHAGASDLRYNMINGWCGKMLIGDEVPIETGNIAGPLSQGRTGLLGSNPLPWADFDINDDRHSSRVILVPIVHLINTNRQDEYTVNDWYGNAPWSHNYVVVDGFAPFFILTVGEQGNVDGQGGSNDPDWIVGYFIPGIEINTFTDPDYDNPEYGMWSTPRLID